MQPPQAGRPGLALPVWRVAGRPAAGDPALVGGAHCVHGCPLSPRRRSRDLAPRWPEAVRRTGRRPRQILASTTRADGALDAAGRALAAFFTSRRLILPGDEARRRGAARRQRYLNAVPAGLAGAVTAFNDDQLADQDRARRTGRRQLSDTTLETRLPIMRDLASHLAIAARSPAGPRSPPPTWKPSSPPRLRSRHPDTYVLRRYFAWARQHKLILIDPARPRRLGAQPGFTGSVLDADTQQALFRRWTSATTHPHERLTGLLALLHAASNAQIRSLTITGIDTQHRALALARRPFPAPADPATWAAVRACLSHRDKLSTLNPDVIVTNTTRTGDAPADGSYLTRRLAPAAPRPSACPADPDRAARQRPRPQAHRRRARHARHRPGALPRRQRRPRPA